MGQFEIPINSNFFGTIQYVVFDLVLAICVHVLTSKLVGLYNCYDALKNPTTCHLCDGVRAPLFETGIMCTKKKFFYGVVFLRILSWILIFSTNQLVRGRSEQFSSARLTTRGGFSLFDPYPLLNHNRLLRLACMRRSKYSAYYGEIRNGTCEMNRELFTEPPIEFGPTFQPTIVSTAGCILGNSLYRKYDCNSTMTPSSKAEVQCIHNETNGALSRDVCYINGSAPHTSCLRNDPREQQRNVRFNCGGRGEYMCLRYLVAARKFSICDNAVVSCRTEHINGVQVENCAGLLNKDGVTRMCIKLAEGNLQDHNASCKIAKGLDWNITDWIPFYGLPPLLTISAIVPVAYGSGEQVKQIKVYTLGDERTFTDVRYLWIGVLIAKIVVVVVLLTACEVLSRRYQLFAVANDEPRLYSLLKTTVNRIRIDRNLRNGPDYRLRVMLDDGVIKLYNVDERRITSDHM